MGKSKKLTPLMQQYWSVKTAHSDKILLFRMGDFFEMFYEDAQKAAPILGIALTSRNKKSGDQTPMCGVPHHSIGGQINKLLAQGLKVAICDQVEDAKFAKGIVKREVTRILSPGMVYDPDTLESQTSNYLCAFDPSHISFLEPTTGECFFYEIPFGISQYRQLIDTLDPVEVVCSKQQNEIAEDLLDAWAGVQSAHEELLGEESFPPSARRLVSYAISMQGESLLKTLSPFEKRESDFRLQINSNTLRHLEVFRTTKNELQGTLYSSVNRTKTAGGARLLRQWLCFPLADKKKIEERQQKVEEWTSGIDALKVVRSMLAEIGDIERRLGKISNPNCHPRDLQSLGQSLEVALSLLPHIKDLANTKKVEERVKKLSERLLESFVDEIPGNYRDGGFVARNFSPELDELIDLATNGQKKVQELEVKEKKRTGISSLKIRYNNVFGYYIEVTNTHKNKVPTDRYLRKQTLTNAERYCTDELNELEKQVLSAKSKRNELELEIFSQMKEEVLNEMIVLLDLARGVSHLDVFSSFAWLAIENNYCRPQLLEEGELNLEGSRHPVVEQFVERNFVANDVVLKPKQCLLLTGPNMAGKSTLMRQVAVTHILAQVGCFVPARRAQLPIVDKIFTRIGASDFLTEGLSTFMVEMQETAEMLRNATEKSLVILDEVGRGTSTYDGMSLAQSILEYFLRKLKSTTLFATHYHELTSLEERYPDQLLNRHMAIVEKSGQIDFLYTLEEGPALKSYGLQVAKLAGLPTEVVKYASQLLSKLEKGEKSKIETPQLDLWQAPAHELVDDKLLGELKDLNIQKMTPLEALNTIAQWQEKHS